jgi:hypothetical protein
MAPPDRVRRLTTTARRSVPDVEMILNFDFAALAEDWVGVNDIEVGGSVT